MVAEGIGASIVRFPFVIMADPLSIAAGVIGIVAAGTKLASALHNICETIGSAQEEIEDIASDLSYLVPVVDQLGSVFEAPERVYSDNLSLGVLAVIQKCKDLFRRINHMIKETSGVPKQQLKTKVAWVFREKKVKAIKAKLDSLKITLIFMLQTLSIAQHHRQLEEDDRQALGNLLRSQQRSVRVLRDIEQKNKEKKAAPQSPLESSSAQLNPHTTSSHTTAEVLSEVVPSPPAKHQTGAYPDSKEPSSPLEKTPNSVAWAGSFEKTLGAIYPIWEERVLKNIDYIFTQWVQPPSPNHTQHDTTSTESPIDSGDDGGDNSGDEIAEEIKIKNSFDEEISSLDASEHRCKTDRKKFEERLQAIQERLKKRENGWLEIDGRALTRLNNEMAQLGEQKVQCDVRLNAFAELRKSLTQKNTEALHEFARKKEEREELKKKQKQRMDEKYKDRFGASSPYPQPHPTTPGKPALRPPVSLQWLEEDPQSIDSDPDEDEERSTKRGTTPYPPASTPTELPAELPADPIPTPDIPLPPSPPPPPSSYPFPSPNQTLPIHCSRLAWKAPQPFLDGHNTFTHVLRMASYPLLWFKASQDTYEFFHGASKTSFYTIRMIPDDMSSHETSKVEWTVVEKPWAMPKTLSTLNWPYFEDSIGFMWIKKELNWYQIQEIFQVSCTLLDNAIHESSRTISQKRSEDAGKREKSFLSSLQHRTGEARTIHEQHRTFFHADDEELGRRLKKLEGGRFHMRVSS
ncbi:hypothetical protein FGG08_004264 [Glutinoglossum americanum]|uniref:Azaphilone pigments biosynthesis cluster protein L N-terminal domain-containing protein n=1 Tax=Glutinoglossum americanum TaxID=1670608 RepID=A0A9P8I5G8_9PEZI|nr:hypothetical protein FGG08_004264 [Glutinoglossum americanum]